MSVEDDYKAIVKRLRGWGFKITEYSGCYGRSNGSSWSKGRPEGHVNHHYVCSMNPDQGYINSLVSSLANNKTVQWFADVNGAGYLLGTGPMNHAGTGNSSVLARIRNNQANYSVAGSAGDMSGNQALPGTEGQHPGDSTPWPQSLLNIMWAINAAEFLQWGYPAVRAIHHYAWTNRKIDMSHLGGPKSGETGGRNLMQGVQSYMDKGGAGGATTPEVKPPPPAKEWDEMATKAEIAAVVQDELKKALPRALLTLLTGASNSFMNEPKGFERLYDGYGVQGYFTQGVNASRTGKPQKVYPAPAKPKD